MTKNHRGLIALAGGAIALGFAPVFVRWSEVGMVATAFWRVSLSLPFLALWLIKDNELPKGSKKSMQWIMAIVAGIFFGFDLSFWHWSIRLTSVANATFETNLSAVFIPLASWLIFGHRLSHIFVVALIIALSGTFLVVGTSADFSQRALIGDLCGVASALFYSGYLICLRVARMHGAKVGFTLAISGVSSSVFLFLSAAIWGERMIPLTIMGWITILALALVSQILGQGLVTYALGIIHASQAALGLLIQPAAAAIAAWILLKEKMTPLQMAGAAVLCFGLWLSVKGRDITLHSSPPISPSGKKSCPQQR